MIVFSEKITIKTIKLKLNFIYYILIHKYGFDIFNQLVIAGSVKKTRSILWKFGDTRYAPYPKCRVARLEGERSSPGLRRADAQGFG